MLYVWIAVLVVTVLLEALTSDLVAIWFVPAALVSLILSFFPAPIWLQLLVFIATGIVLVISTRPICRKLMKGRRERTNAEALIGKTCIVTEEIRNLDEVGEVKLGGLCWSARSAEQDRVIAVGEQVVVMEIQGVKLIVK